MGLISHYNLGDDNDSVDPGSTIGLLLRQYDWHKTTVCLSGSEHDSTNGSAGLTFLASTDDSVVRENDIRLPQIDQWLGGSPRTSEGAENMSADYDIQPLTADNQQPQLPDVEVYDDYVRRIKVRVLEMTDKEKAKVEKAVRHDLTEFYHELRLISLFAQQNEDTLYKVMTTHSREPPTSLNTPPRTPVIS